MPFRNAARDSLGGIRAARLEGSITVMPIIQRFLQAALVGAAVTWAAGVRAEEPEKAANAAEYKVSEETVRYSSGPDTVRAVLYKPDIKGAAPGIVVIHEWWGLNGWIRESARRLAALGYVTMAIDLYRGAVATDAEEAHELMRGLPEDRASRDLQMAVEYLRSRKEVQRDRIASVGWCMGGGYSLQTALVVPDLAACVICYGRLVTEDATIASLNAPVLGIFGAEDRGIAVATVEQFDQQATKLGKSVDMYLFDKAGHAFMNPTNKSGYNLNAADSAWSLIDTFLDAKLRPKKSTE